MREQFERLGIAATFFDAVTIPEDRLPLVPEYDWKRRMHRYGYGLNAGEVGCYLSHRHVWQAFLASDNDICCVIEDDAHFLPWFSETVKEVVENKEYWDFVRLTCMYRKGARRFRAISETRQLNWVAVAPYSTACYFLNRTGAEVMLKHTASTFRPIDEMMDRSWEHRLRQYVVDPEPVVIDCRMPSLIGERKRPQVPKLTRLRYKAHRVIDKVQRFRFNMITRPEKCRY